MVIFTLLTQITCALGPRETELYCPTTTPMLAAFRPKVQWAAVIIQEAEIMVAPQYWFPPPDKLMSANRACHGHSVAPAVVPPTMRSYRQT